MSELMREQTYTSSQGYANFIPIGMMSLVALCFGSAVAVVVLTSDFSGAMAFCVMGGLLIWGLWVTWRKFGVVTVSGWGMVVRLRGVEQRFGWHEVRSFWTVPFVTPPILRLRFRTSDVVVYFVPVNALSLNVGVWTFHFSGMGRFIRQQLDSGRSA
jgi:hypothetical protein